MQIRKLKVDGHNCLIDFEVNFDISENGGSSTILIGENGTGKSTMMKTVMLILMSFDSDSVKLPAGCRYELEYFYKGDYVTIRYQDGRYSIRVGNDFTCAGSMKTVKNKLQEAGRNIFPERVSYFYSGLNDQLAGEADRVKKNYEQKCRMLLRRYWNALYLANHEYEGEFPKRKYIFCTENYVPVYLLAIMCGNDNPHGKEMLMKQCKIEEIGQVTIMMDLNGIRKHLANDLLETGEEGVYDLIKFIDHRFESLFRENNCSVSGNLFISWIYNMNTFDIDSVSVFNFFEKLILLFDAKIDVNIKVGGNTIFTRDLSEGQRQLIKIFGMLGVCRGEDAIVLMDEPDAHMNPKWKYDLKSIIDECLDDPEIINTQAIIATHDPLVINGVDKEHIRIFARDEGELATTVREPEENTSGMGIDGILQSEYYGLVTSYDKKATDLFARRQELYIKLINGEATDDEKNELRRLTKKAGSMPISYNSIDFLYDDFIKAFREMDEYKMEYLSYEEIVERRRKIKEIIRTLYEG